MPTLAEQIAFFEKNAYVFIPNALSAAEVKTVNEAIDGNRAEYPSLWGQGNRSQSVQCFLAMPDVDGLLQHPSWFPIAKAVLDNDIVFSEFSIMIRSGYSKAGIEGWHRDFQPNAKQRLKITALSVIYYLTDVNENTPRYCLVPGSNERTEPPKKLREDSEDREGEVQMFGPAGSAILVNAGIWHCGRWSDGPAERRTVHLYFQPGSIPPVSQHNIFPRRLWDVPDAEQRKFFSHFNTLSKAVAGDYAAK